MLHCLKPSRPSCLPRHGRSGDWHAFISGARTRPLPLSKFLSFSLIKLGQDLGRRWQNVLPWHLVNLVLRWRHTPGSKTTPPCFALQSPHPRFVYTVPGILNVIACSFTCTTNLPAEQTKWSLLCASLSVVNSTAAPISSETTSEVIENKELWHQHLDLHGRASFASLLEVAGAWSAA